MNFWVSWIHEDTFGPFELHSPWWISGYTSDGSTICAAIRGDSPAACRGIVYTSYDKRPEAIEFRFAEERAPDWSPFCDRFPQADWMQW